MSTTTPEKGNRLRKIIEHTGLSQTKFALKAGLRPNYITSIVNGYKDLSGSILETIAFQYGNKYNIGWLLTGNGKMLLEPEESAIQEPMFQYRTIEERIQALEDDMSTLKRLIK